MKESDAFYLAGMVFISQVIPPLGCLIFAIVCFIIAIYVGTRE